MKTTMRVLLAMGLMSVMIYSGYRLWLIQADYKQESQLHDAVMEYKPQEDDSANQSVIGLRAKYPDAAGWLTVPGTNIDYPFVQSKDNDYYLRRDLDGRYAFAGTLFMDCRCAPDFTAQNTIIYGHHMKNGSMFGGLKAFADKDFFDENRGGTIFLPYTTLSLEFFAYLVIPSGDGTIYSPAPGEEYLDYVKQNARNYRDIGLTGEDRVVTLSTCAYEFDDARMVLLAKMGQ